MRKKVLKIGIVLAMILSMTMANFIFVGSALISYAADNVATNHGNVEFKTYFKNEKGEEVTTLENGSETFLYLNINVKREGYFNGEIEVENSNFTLKETDSVYVNKIENNTIYLNQINAGSTNEIKIKVEPIKEENYNIGLLDMVSKINIKGIYRDSTQRDIKIQAQREVTLALSENNEVENVKNEMKVITNKIVEIDGQQKRIVQISYNMGLHDNNYPIKEIYAQIDLPEAERIERVEYLNNMTSFDYKENKNKIDMTLKNDITADGKVMWKKQGEENVILTCIYDKDVKTEDMTVQANEKITLYNGKELETKNNINVGTEEVDNIIEVQAKNSEDTIYKGKLNAGIEREYQSLTQLKINFADATKNIGIAENGSKYINENGQEDAHVQYKQTIVKKEQIEKLFGKDGKIEIYNENGEKIADITSMSQADENGNIIINYDGQDIRKMNIITTKAVEEGILNIYHVKTIKSNDEIDKARDASELQSTVIANAKEIVTNIKLENAMTEATLEVDKESLSTVIRNNVEIKAVLMSNNEKYDLYKNPEIAIGLPEQVQNIDINSIDLLYENELKIKDYYVDGRTIHVVLEGEQTQYKEETIGGATIVIGTTIDVDRKATNKEETIQMAYRNNSEIGETNKPIKIVAPTDMTTIYSIPELGIETLGQEEEKQILIERGEEEKTQKAQIEIINNKEEAVENVKVLGEFPNNNKENNMGVEIVEGISLQGIENAKVYYSENQNATDDLENAENAWTETITDGSKVSKYLIEADSLDVQGSMQGSFMYKIPAGLEYNQTASTGYQVKYTDSNTKVEDELNSTDINIQTGVGPKVETKLTATVGGKEINGPVKQGEVIKYSIEVANVGTEDVHDVVVTGNVPEGTSLVVPEENYEYTGASYYKELEDKNYETVIETLKVGEVIYKTYEVRVNGNTVEGTNLSNTAQVKYGDVTKQSEEIKNTTTNGDIRATVKSVSGRRNEFYKGQEIEYYAIIENTSDKTQKDVKVQTNLPQTIEVNVVQLITGTTTEELIIEDTTDDDEEAEIDKEIEDTTVDYEPNNNVKREDIEFSDEINIGSLEPEEAKIIYYIAKAKDENTMSFSITAKNGKTEYNSNIYQVNVKNVEIGMEMTVNTEGQYLETGDEIEYTINVKNKTNSNIEALSLIDVIPEQLTIEEITQDGENIEYIESNIVKLFLDIGENETSTATIKAVVDHSEGRDAAEAITNVAYAEFLGEKIATTSEINHIIRANSENEDEENNGGDNVENGENNIGDNDIAKGKRMITGVAWYDENANGQKDQGEKLLNNVKVRLLNTQTNNFVKTESGSILEATTNENGVYVLDKIGNGKYIAIFDYDEVQYALTKYKVSGVSEVDNSNVVSNELLIENERKQVASTDILQIQDSDISNINIGLIKRQNFDLKLDKYVSKIVIQNSNGTTVREYDNETMAKVELDAKTVNGSTVIIEYKINVTNNGEIEGYARKISDYLPTDLKFSSELNKDWYQVGDTLQTATLSNEKIKPGETKTVTLTLTKAMTENNTGLTLNTAEIAEDYNELGIADSNSTPENRVKDENDFGEAEVVLSIRTGGIVYVSIAIIVVVLLAVTAVIILKKKKQEDKE